MKNYNLDITEKGVFINDTLINEDIFQEEKVNFSVVERDDQIDHLIDWIGECGRDRKNDKFLMKEDLKYLINQKDDYLFSSILTNEYVCKSDNLEDFNDVCKEILKLNKELGK